MIAHEMVHVIVHNSLQQSHTGLLGERIAVWLNGQDDAAHNRKAAQLRTEGELPSLDGLLTDFRAQSNSYPAAGSFCGWFLSEYGLEAFQEIYPLENPSSRAEELVGRRIESMQEDWHAALTKYREWFAS